jgi:hypothetical protein
VNQALTRLASNPKIKGLEDLKFSAMVMTAEMNKLDKLMEGLCKRTCPDCLGVCCQARNIYYDFSDLLYIHLSQTPIPSRQTRRGPEEPCHYLTSMGCSIPRPQRPFICSWFICSDQEEIISRMLWGKETKLIQSLDKLLLMHRDLEKNFISLVG